MQGLLYHSLTRTYLFKGKTKHYGTAYYWHFDNFLIVLICIFLELFEYFESHFYSIVKAKKMYCFPSCMYPDYSTVKSNKPPKSISEFNSRYLYLLGTIKLGLPYLFVCSFVIFLCLFINLINTVFQLRIKRWIKHSPYPHAANNLTE